MLTRLTTAFVLLGLVAGCASPPPAPPVATGPLNRESWVGTQSPGGTQNSSSPQAPFQTPNSLPRGAATTAR